MRRMDDSGVSAVIGAIVVFAIFSSALIYTNAIHVPRQGASLEVALREDAERSLGALAGELVEDDGALVDVALRPAPAPPALLAGLVLSPVRADGGLRLEPGANVSVSVVVPASGAVASDDPTRVDLGDGLVRVFLVGNKTGARSVGALELALGGTYTPASSYRVEGGALLLGRDGASEGVALGALRIARGGSAASATTDVAWTLPLLAGEASEVGGVGAAQVALVPGPVARAGGTSPLHNVTIVVETQHVAGWRALLEEAVGGHGTVAASLTGADSGVVTAIVLPPAGTLPGTRAVTLDLTLLEQRVLLTGRSG